MIVMQYYVTIGLLLASSECKYSSNKYSQIHCKNSCANLLYSWKMSFFTDELVSRQPVTQSSDEWWADMYWPLDEWVLFLCQSV